MAMMEIRMKSRSQSQSLWPGALALFFAGYTSVSAETMHIKKVATYADTTQVRQELRAECKLDTLLPEMMREEVLNRTSIRNVVLMDDLPGKTAGLAMELSILDLKIPPATGWTTEIRALKVKSVIYRDGNIASEYVRNAQTQGGGNMFRKLFKNRNSCQVVDRLARDVSEQTVERFKLMKLLPEAAPASVGHKQPL
jgi:hypothetical protein